MVDFVSHLFRSQLPPEAGLLVVFSSNDAFLLDNRYQATPAVHPEDVMAVLLRVEKKTDQIPDSICRFIPLSLPKTSSSPQVLPSSTVSSPPVTHSRGIV